MKGKIMWISKREGNGIIISEDNKEFYFDTSVTQDFNNLRNDDLVIFEPNINKTFLGTKNVKKE